MKQLEVHSKVLLHFESIRIFDNIISYAPFKIVCSNFVLLREIVRDGIRLIVHEKIPYDDVVKSKNV